MEPHETVVPRAGTSAPIQRGPGPVTPSPIIATEVDEPKNRVQWGPIVAGTITALVTMLLLSILGLALGASAFEPGTDRSDWGTAAGIWGGISALVAFFLGGWVGAKTAAVGGSFAGLINGLMVGAATILVLLWLTTTGLTNLLGFAANSLTDVASVASEIVGEEITDIGNEADEAAEGVQAAAPDEDGVYDRVRDGAWGTFIVMILALGAATVGGWLGRNEQFDLGRTVRPRSA